MVAGIDEAGRGALAGPVVAAAVVLNPDSGSIEGVRDSKLIPEAEREVLYYDIQSSALAVSIGIVESSMIDSINILHATLLAMRKAVDSFSPQPGQLLVDGNRFYQSTIPYTTIIGGDAISLSIAAASVIAKVTRDRLMRQYDEEFPGYGFAQHKGYGTQRHVAAIRSMGPSKIHRQTFLTKIGRALAPQ